MNPLLPVINPVLALGILVLVLAPVFFGLRKHRRILIAVQVIAFFAVFEFLMFALKWLASEVVTNPMVLHVLSHVVFFDLMIIGLAIVFIYVGGFKQILTGVPVIGPLVRVIALFVSLGFLIFAILWTVSEVGWLNVITFSDNSVAFATGLLCTWPGQLLFIMGPWYVAARGMRQRGSEIPFWGFLSVMLILNMIAYVVMLHNALPFTPR